MPRLKHIIIGDEEHLTFESIRQLALRQLSKSDELKARKHLNRCSRCQGIYDSFVIPATVRKRMSRRKTASRALIRVLLLLSMVGSASIFLSDEGVMDLKIEEVITDWNIEEVMELSELYIHRLLNQSKITKLTPNPPETEISKNFIVRASPGLNTIDTLARVVAKPKVKTTPIVDQPLDSYMVKEEGKDKFNLREIHGKITDNGDPLKGVTVMVPGGKTARVSDANGKYYIRVTESTNSLLFIYQGKQLIKRLHPESRQQDIQLKIENMSYPDIEFPASITENL